jgi:hypothetical protein
MGGAGCIVDLAAALRAHNLRPAVASYQPAPAPRGHMRIGGVTVERVHPERRCDPSGPRSETGTKSADPTLRGTVRLSYVAAERGILGGS